MASQSRAARAVLTCFVLTACTGGSGPTSSTGETQQAVLTTNGFTQNGFTQNGLTINGFTQNGFTQNGFTQNGFTQNGFTQNGFTQNGYSGPGLLQTAFTGPNVLANGYIMDALKADMNARKLLQYMYSCAMPAGATIGFDLDGNPSTGDASGNDLVLTGSLGLTPQWGQAGGTCDLSCQRWISACVLARTNAFGARVDLSVRGPNPAARADWPLTVFPGSDEATTFNRREGSYFGNIFATTTDSGGNVKWAPELHACAGPNSDIPYLSLRFCSSLEDDCVIDAVANCAEDTSFAPAACDTTLGPSGEATHCWVDPNNKTATGVEYDEVITVYLKDQLLAVCGNHVCEPEGGETNASCPADCHADTWATRIEMGTGLSTVAFHGELGRGTIQETFNELALDSSDQVVMGGLSDDDVNLGGGTLSISRGRGYLAKYSSTGAHLWSERIGADVNAVATDSSGNVAVAATVGTASSGVIYDGPSSAGSITVPRTTGASEVVLAKLNASGTRQWAVTFGGDADPAAGVLGDDEASRALTADPAGNWIVAGSFDGTGDFGASLTAVDSFDVFVTKVSASGSAQWAVRLGGTGADHPTAVTTDAAGNILVSTSEANDTASGLYKLGADGAVVWSKLFTTDPVTSGSAMFHKAIFDASGNVYVAGTVGGQFDFGGGLVDSGAGGLFLAKYDGAGALQWVKTVPGYAIEQDLRIDSFGDVLVFGEYDLSGINFGAGPFSSRDPDTFIVSYKPDGTFVWALPISGYGNNVPRAARAMAVQVDALAVGLGGVPDSAMFTGFGLDSHGRIVGTGLMDGFLLFDNRMLVNWVPPLSYDADAFVGSFNPPCSGDGCDTTPPVFVAATIPGTIYVEATEPATSGTPAGQFVSFAAPTATDQDNAGNIGSAQVVCNPDSVLSTPFFPVGDNTVTCTAYDPHGNTATTSFHVIVLNKIPPTFFGTPPTGPFVAPSSAGVVVNYTAPTAVDQLDGPVAVSCTPASGANFAIGTTTVTCSASDLAGNTNRVGFPIKVVAAGDWNPPVITAPSGIAVVSSSASGMVVGYTVSATDDVDGTVPVSCSPASGTVFHPGTTTVSCTAHDKAGNVANASFPVSVTYSWSGILQPINADGSSVFKLGSTVPVKFQLTGASASIGNLVANLTAAKITNNIAGSYIESTSTSAADTGNQFRYAGSGAYIFNMSTANMSVGTWMLRIDLHDGVDRYVRISLK
jgi:hypothetical protein